MKIRIKPYVFVNSLSEELQEFANDITKIKILTEISKYLDQNPISKSFLFKYLGLSRLLSSIRFST